jgi:hypothetical protein
MPATASIKKTKATTCGCDGAFNFKVIPFADINIGTMNGAPATYYTAVSMTYIAALPIVATKLWVEFQSRADKLTYTWELIANKWVVTVTGVADITCADTVTIAELAKECKLVGLLQLCNSQNYFLGMEYDAPTLGGTNTFILPYVMSGHFSKMKKIGGTLDARMSNAFEFEYKCETMTPPPCSTASFAAHLTYA